MDPMDFLSKGPILFLVFCPRTRPGTFFNCFAIELSVFKTKQLRNVLQRVLGPENYLQNPSLYHVFKILKFLNQDKIWINGHGRHFSVARTIRAFMQLLRYIIG